MATWEEDLPPLTKAKLAAAGESGPEERELARQKKEVQSLLANFYKDDLDPVAFCRELKSGTPFMIREAQLSLVQSLSLSYSSHNFERRKTAILDLERLKKNQSVGLIEDGLNKIGEMQRAYREAQEKALEEVTEERSRNHQPTIGPGRWIALHGTVSVDADMTERLAESLLQAERTYGHEFAETIRQLTSLIDSGK
jgi:hypothetical protein